MQSQHFLLLLIFLFVNTRNQYGRKTKVKQYGRKMRVKQWRISQSLLDLSYLKKEIQ